MSVQDRRVSARADVAAPSEDELQTLWNRVVGRRSFLREAGLVGATATGVSAVSAGGATARAHKAGGPTPGDFAVLRFLAAAELLETDLWEQYADFGGVDGKNEAYMSALENLDEDMPQYISDNTDDEQSHAAFINAYLRSKGQRAVNLDRFRTLEPSKATGGGTAKRLTNLTSLNVYTSWYLRYRSTKNPDFGAKFGQAVNIKNQPAIPVDDAETPPGGMAPVPPTTRAQQRMQAIANSAGFHFAMIEQGGSSLYTTMSMKVTSLEVLRIVVAIGGVEVNHFAIWHDKAGNAVSDPLGDNVRDPITGTSFPDLNKSGSEATQTNLIMPEPCEFIPGLPDCSVIRPTLDSNAGAMAAVNALTADGLFKGQSPAFFRAIKHLARAADAAQRRTG
jgi:hypothetical protein